MENLQTLTLHLPERTLRAIASKVASGQFASPEAVIEQSIDQMEDLDQKLEDWIATEGLAIADRMKADPSRGLSPEQVLKNLDIDNTDTRAA